MDLDTWRLGTVYDANDGGSVDKDKRDQPRLAGE